MAVEFQTVRLCWGDGVVSTVEVLSIALPGLRAEGAVARDEAGWVAPAADISVDEVMAFARHTLVPKAVSIVLTTPSNPRLVSEAARLARLGLPQSEIAGLLTEGGFRARSGAPISQNTVSDILLSVGIRRRSFGARQRAEG